MNDPVPQPTIYVIAGPNGAGKTTFATKFLPDFVQCDEFLNADLIAAGLSPFAPHTQNFRASELLLERIQELTRINASFSFETTLAGRSYAQFIPKIRQAGYLVYLFFLWLPSADLAVARVANRVQQGGHDIPETDIRRRFCRGLANFGALYSDIVDGWFVYDSSVLPPGIVAQRLGPTITIFSDTIWNSMTSDSGGER